MKDIGAGVLIVIAYTVSRITGTPIGQMLTGPAAWLWAGLVNLARSK